MSNLKVACVQISAYDLAHAEAGLLHALEMIDVAGQGGAELIVLPECTYPAYFLRGESEYAQAGLRSWNEIIALFGDKAREHGCHLVVGLAHRGEDACCLLNAAILFGPDGEIIGSTNKSFLWHFDQRWFKPGKQYEVFDTSIGRIGLIVCADGRMPEIARILALQGAQVIVDPTAWVTSGGDRATLSNPQFEYMIPVRALENGAWFVVANKVGLEANTILYCGRSCVIDPAGNKVVAAGADREEVVFCDIDISQATGTPVRRKPEMYATIAQPTEDQPAARLMREKVVPEQTVVRVAAFQLADYTSVAAYWSRVEELVDTVSRQDVRLVVLPGTVPADADGDAIKSNETLGHLAGLSATFGCGIAATLNEYDGAYRYRTCFLWDAGKLVGKYRKAHPDAGYVAGNELAVFDTSFGRLGIMLDEEGLLPEVARCLMLKGADTILWPSRPFDWPLPMVARSRADENKVHVVLATAMGPSLNQVAKEGRMGKGTAIINPGGAIVAAALPDVEQVIAVQVVWALSRYKEMAPNTNVVWSRMPETYEALVK